MVKVKENVFDIEENIIVCLVGSEIEIPEELKEDTKHIDSEYRKFLRHCNKNHINLYGKVQYIPNQVWAVGMVDTMNNTSIIPCMDFKYIANLFCIRDECNIIDEKSMKKGMTDILTKAKSINENVALFYKDDGNNLKFNVVMKIAEKIFGSSEINLTIYKVH
jgi:hypothetical protein